MLIEKSLRQIWNLKCSWTWSSSKTFAFSIIYDWGFFACVEFQSSGMVLLRIFATNWHYLKGKMVILNDDKWMLMSNDTQREVCQVSNAPIEYSFLFVESRRMELRKFEYISIKSQPTTARRTVIQSPMNKCWFQSRCLDGIGFHFILYSFRHLISTISYRVYGHVRISADGFWMHRPFCVVGRVIEFTTEN